MSYIRKYRVNAGDIVRSTEFYFKVETSNGRMLCNLCIGDDGLYYYRAKSQILSPKENKRTRNTYDGFFSMENLNQLFDTLRKAKLAGSAGSAALRIRRERRTVIIEADR